MFWILSDWKKIKKILVTGAAGFIGFHVCQKLVNLGFTVVGLDNINDYYYVNLKYARLHELEISRSNAEDFFKKSEKFIYKWLFSFVRMDLEDAEHLPRLFKNEVFDTVCNLAAQAVVRYSIQNPKTYIDSNIQGFLNILECCIHHNIYRFVYASSSSVYGNSDNIPFKETDNVDYPISL